jgi:hypothetical protein
MRELAAASHFVRVCAESITKIVLSFRDGPKDQARNLEIPGSLASLTPRNDGIGDARAQPNLNE